MKNTEITPHCFICNRRVILWVFALAVLIITLLILLPAATVSFQRPNNTWDQTFLEPSQQIAVAGTPLTVAIADSHSEITQGLSGRERLKDGRGLLFIFQDTDYRTFWMKDMKFAIDMIFIRDGVIVDIAQNMPAPSPHNLPAAYKSQSPANMVLEVNAGLADYYGWEAGCTINY
ncbi:hypothetical protein GF391_00355 [Candidatus Uhrbacteria bacterium]|nr:hypothetical protein [Candidatus Uhrbacteria bacterium]